MKLNHLLHSLLAIAILSTLLAGQETPTSRATVPRLVNFSGRAADAQGKPIAGISGVTFAIYKDQFEGAPLWLETQNVAADARGNYTVQLGATRPAGLPLDLFSSGEARWLGVQVSGQAEQPRILLLSVPYALKAADAETIGGLPPSAFVLAAPTSVSGSISNSAVPSASATPPASSDVTTTGGTASTLPVFTTATNIQSSAITQTGSGTTAKIGVNTTAPAATLDVTGSETVRGLLTLPATGVATATAGKPSQAQEFIASSFSSASSAAVHQTFLWQAEQANNNTANPGATLNLLYGAGAAKPAETGLRIGPKGIIGFAPGQTFPNVAGDETVTGNFSSGGSVNATTSFDIGGTAFAFGSTAKANAFLGFAGNSTMTGSYNTASGYQALPADTSGASNAAFGSLALFSNTTGSYNTAMGATALYWNTAGVYNTAVGFQALNNNTTGGSNTATGLNALFANTSGGQNTASGYDALFANTSGSYNTALGSYALYLNTTGTYNTALGTQALVNNTTGANNAAFGTYALYSNTTAGGNTAHGYAALFWNSTGANNTATGFQALNNNSTGAENSAAGYEALFTNTVGYDNTASGYDALYSNTTGWDNTADGWNALRSNTQGTFNTATGNQTMYWNTTGINNTADGYASLNHNTTGGTNTATGALALNVNTTGGGNTADGVYALALSNGDTNTAVGAYALGNNTTGAQNTAVGYYALVNNNTGNGLTCVGYNCETGSDALTNATAIGAHAKVSQSNSLVLGGAGAYAVKVGIGTDAPSSVLTIARGAGHPVSDSWETYSSRRWKTNIQLLRNALSTVEQLRGVSYELKDSGRHEIGVIAEEVGAVVPEVVTYEENGKDARGVDYSRLTALLIEAVKQQQREIHQQKAALRTQAVAIRGLKSDLQATRQSLRNVTAKVAASRLDEVAAK